MKNLHIIKSCLLVLCCSVNLQAVSATDKVSIPIDPDAKPTQEYFHGQPTGQEQYFLEIINRARENPLKEIKRIINSGDDDILNALKTYNINTADLTAEFRNYTPMPPLAFNNELMQSARGHSEDMANNNFQGHNGSDGSTLSERLNAAGYDFSIGGENVFAYAKSIWHAHAAFLIDWGVKSLGHRNNTLNLGTHTDFRETGISIVPENNSRTTVGPLVITEDFGRSHRGVVFITGVAYRDDNENSFYDNGEGLDGVLITPNHGPYYAITSNSGGFAIPVAADSGLYTLTATRDDLPQMKATVNVAGRNIKVDFILGDPAYASINGTITQSKTGEPLAGVTVNLAPVGLTYTTDTDGKFTFTDLPAAGYIITANLAGFEFSPNDFGVTLTAGQKFRPGITASRTAEPSAADSITNPANAFCGGPGIAIIGMIMLFARSLLVSKEG